MALKNVEEAIVERIQRALAKELKRRGSHTTTRSARLSRRKGGETHATLAAFKSLPGNGAR